MYSRRKSLNFGQYIPDDKVLNKKVPENPKYKHVRPAIDTGKNVKSHIDELKEKQKSCNHKKDEVFYRVKLSSFIKLAISVAQEIFKQEERGDFSSRLEVENSSENHKEDKNILANVLIGIGEIDLRNERKRQPVSQPKIERKIPYLLLDVRDQEEFRRGHIKTAKHYPASMLSRSIGYEIEEMKHYKNNRPELIVLYDNDESIAPRVATTLVQRGYDNIYVLSGGLNLGYEIFPRALMASVTSRLPSKMSPSSSVQIKTSSEYFSQEDVENIQQYLEDCPQRSYPVGNSKSCTSYSKSDKSSSFVSKQSGSSMAYAGKCGSVTFRKDSASSSRSFETTRMRAASTDARFKTAKKAPWK